MKKLTKKKKRILLLAAGAVLLIFAAAYTVIIQPLLEKEETVFREAAVFRGKLAIEVVESGSLEYTIHNITYDIDVNVAEEKEEDEEEEEELTQKYLQIEEIYKAAGTQMTAGDALLKFSDESVSGVRKLLQNALINANADYNEAESEYKLAVLEAESAYEKQIISGKYAGTIYKEENSQITGDITSMELELVTSRNNIGTLEEKVADAQEAYEEAKELYDKVYYSYMNDYASAENGPSFMQAQSNYLSVKNSFERAESSLKQAKQNLENNAEQIKTLEQNIALAKAKSVITALEVELSYAESKMNSENAAFTLDATLESLIEDLEDAEEEKKALEEKLAAFEELVGTDGIVYAPENGLITAVSYSVGDTLEQIGNLFSYASEDGMHITVDVTQEDIVTLAVGDEVTIDFSAYEDTYTGYIESINTTATSAETPTVSYQVVLQVIGTLDKLFDGMSANVTFVTDEKEDAVYLSRKAVIEENGKNYVYVKSGLAGKELTEVETGMRNDNYIEILSGVSAGNMIYIPEQKPAFVSKTTTKKKEESTYREAVVEYGSLVVGIEESGSVDIGTVGQVFELDMSALKRVETSNSGVNGSMGSSAFGGSFGGAGGMGGVGGMGGSGGGSNNMFGQIFDMAGGSNVTIGSTSGELEIAEVCVSVGQEVEAGDALYRLEESGVEKLAGELESNVTKAKADLDALVADQELTKVTAENTYKTSAAYGSYASTERNSTITSLRKTVEEKKQALQTAQENIASIQAQVEQATYDYNLAAEVLHNSEWSRDNTDKSDVFSYTYYFELAQEAESSASSLEQNLEKLKSNLEQAEKNLANCETDLAKAERNLASGALTAEETYELRMLAYENAQETYNITLAYLEDDLATQQEIYAEAKEKWDEFSAHIDGTWVRAKDSGIITSVDLAVGDALTTGASIVTLYDINEVSMTVTLEEEEMAHIEEGGLANISFTAYPDEIYKAVVTEISDASSDSSGTTTYDVTVTLQDDASGLFQGMTGNITFITKEMQKVMYVSNRAIIREGTKSYVKVKEADGSIEKKKVVTGFSDGVNVEIVEGLEVGDVVLIESKVSGS